MAKISKSLSFKNAEISKDDMTITEYFKDGISVYKINTILEEWENVKGLSITIRQDDELPSDGDI